MITITKEQAQNRYALLPPTLQDAVFSEQNTEIISSVGEQYHLSDEKTESIASLVGWILLGFLHLEDLPGEIAVEIDVAPQLAKDIANSLNNKIFAVIKPDIDKTYAPVPHEKIQESPTIIQNIIPPSPMPLIAKPITLSDIGWSKQPAAGSNIGLSVAIPTPKPAPTPTPAPSRSPVAPAIPKPAAEPAPMMLHEDTTFKPAEKNASFTLSKPEGSAEMSMNRGITTQAPARPAVLEFGGSATQAGASVPKPPAPAWNSTHPMTGNNGTRNVSQIMPTMSVPIPRPPQAPTTPSLQIPQPPKPPSPPQNIPATPQPGKPIVKDFL